MANLPTNKNQPKQSSGYIKSVAWIIEATFRGFVGYVLLSHFRHNYVVVVAGVYALVTAILIVMAHFVKAHK